MVQLVVFKKLLDQYRKEIMMAKLLMMEGRLQQEGEVVHVIVKRCFDVTKLLNGMTAARNSDPSSLKTKNGVLVETEKKNVFPSAENFR